MFIFLFFIPELFPALDRDALPKIGNQQEVHCLPSTDRDIVLAEDLAVHQRSFKSARRLKEKKYFFSILLVL
jgi:hypothetical protein